MVVVEEGPLEVEPFKWVEVAEEVVLMAVGVWVVVLEGMVVV